MLEYAKFVGEWNDYHQGYRWQKLEGGEDEQQQTVALEAARQLVALGRTIGLFLRPPQSATGADSGLLNGVMQLVIDVRAHCRKNKDFEAADMIRSRLSALNITLEDRSDGTLWRREG